MPSLSEKAIAACVLRDIAKMDAAQVAELLHVSPSQVYRYWQAQAEETVLEHSAADDLDVMLASQDLDDHGKFQAGVARRLAVRLDKVSVSDKAQDALAMPQIAKELRAVVAEIMGASQDDKEWLAGLLTTVRHSEDPKS